MNFIRLNRKYNPNQAKAFYCNIKVSSSGLECIFYNQVIKFTLDDFKHHFGLKSKGNEVYISNAYGLGRANFV